MRNLKFIASIVGVFFVFILSAAPPKIVVEKKNGGKNGYRDIKEKHSGNSHSLSCSNPGREQCTWNQGNPTANQQQLAAIDSYIENQLSDGYYSGTGNLFGTNLWFYWIFDPNTGVLRYSIDEDEPNFNI
jgi:hypothetical protein